MKTIGLNCPESRMAPIGTLKPYPGELRTHNRQQRRKAEKLLRKYGQVVPVIIDESNTIIDGHLVWAIMRELGYDEIAAVVVTGRTDPELRALRLALNRLPQDAGWDNDKLRKELQDLLNLSFDLELTAFSAVEIDYHLDVSETASEPEIPAPQSVAVSLAGDTWAMGNHRIVCGDARDAGLISVLLGGTRAAMAFVDPPYNVKIDGHVSGNGATKHREFAMASGEMSEAEFTVFLTVLLQVLVVGLVANAVIFVCMDWKHLAELLAAARKAGLQLLNICVWTKPTPGLGNFYRSQHELVVVLKAGDGEIRNNMALSGKRRNRSNVWPYRGMNSFGDGRDELVKLHPTVKPVALVADAVRDVSLRGEAVIDTFLGSGTTLMAAEETGRVCFGVEIDAVYVDVAVRRWQQTTRKDAVLLETGETFLEVAERRAADLPEAVNG